MPSDFFHWLGKPTAPREPRKKFVVPIKCQCGQVGSAMWEENAKPSPAGLQPVLLEVSLGFHFRVQKDGRVAPQIICAACQNPVLD